MKDRFSSYAADYAAFRPTYPPELFAFIYKHLQTFEAAWDAGTGNGQAAAVLAEKFNRVLATDISEQQLKSAVTRSNISYRVAGEEIESDPAVFDLVTVAQAIHWFDREKFYAEVKRVLKPDGVVAVWGYGLFRISREIDEVIDHFYTRVIGPYWDAERKHIDNHFRSIEFPFNEISVPLFSFTKEWTMDELAGYLKTWSAVRKFMAATDRDPVEGVIRQLEVFRSARTFKVTFPLFMRMGRVR